MTAEHSVAPKKNDNKFKCLFCDRIFANKCLLRRHIQSVQERAIKAKCSFCGNTFTDTPNYKQHLLINSGVQSYICQVCGKGFVPTTGMHTQSHSDEYPFTCDIRSKNFRRKQHYEIHVLKHTRKKLHQCETCRKFFSVKNELKMHSWVHKEEWPYLCLHCNKSFNRQCDLLLHLKTHRTLEN